MWVLGVHGGFRSLDEENRHGYALHDAAAVLVHDGEVVSAIEDERINRVKHSNYAPRGAVSACLAQHGLRPADIDRIALNFEDASADYMAVTAPFALPSLRLPARGLAAAAKLLGGSLGIDVEDKIRFCNHHRAHAWSAIGASGYESGLSLVIDGDGDEHSGMVALHEGTKLEILRQFSTDQSLGNFYTSCISVLGFARFDEYKAMGLAPYGDPAVHRQLFQGLYGLAPKGEYFLAPIPMCFFQFREAGLLGDAVRAKGQAFTQAHMDFAASLQETLETIVLHVLTHFRHDTGKTRLCLSGGVAHNCSANGRVAASGLFEAMFVQPAAHDAGGALGAALAVTYEERPETRRVRMRHVYLGRDLGTDAEIAAALDRWSPLVTSQRRDAIATVAAELLAEGQVLGWVQGRAEFGPRALGNRSILADPRPAENKARINQMVKKREGFRPFAPAVLHERTATYFELPSTEIDLAFMTYVVKVRPEHRATLGAITHVDGTARVQTVHAETSPLFWELVQAFERITGVAMVLNTSFNNNAEPIVDSVDDAVTCFLTTGLDRLVVGDHLVEKAPRAETLADLGVLVPSVPVNRQLVKGQRIGPDGETMPTYAIASMTSEAFGTRDVSLSESAYHVLQRADGVRSLAVILAGAAPDEGQAVREELFEAWCQRALRFRPAKSVC